MADKYLYDNAGQTTEREFITTSTGVASAGKGVATDATGRFDASFLPVGIGADTAAIAASEALAAGDFVNVWNSSGAKARKADASVIGKEAHGFVLAAVASGASATVYFEGTNTQVTGQTPGRVYLSASVPGQAAATAPNPSGGINQVIGFAVSATAINFNSGSPIAKA